MSDLEAFRALEAFLQMLEDFCARHLLDPSRGKAPEVYVMDAETYDQFVASFATAGVVPVLTTTGDILVCGMRIIRGRSAGEQG